MHVLITQLDGKLPNLALMKLAAYHQDRGDVVTFDKFREQGDMLLPGFDKVYGSAIFTRSAARVERFKQVYPQAVVGGTWNLADMVTVEDVIGPDFDGLLYPQRFDASLGFTARGCRFKCGFCVVPRKEGKPLAVKTIADIWRGGSYPKHLHLLDNDFFGQPEEQWRARIEEIRRGRFKVCFNQGINIRMVTDTSAEALASVSCTDDGFKRSRIYTAWDNIGDEGRFFRGIDCLAAHGIKPQNVLAYMLVGYDRRETWERVLYRFDKMRARGIKPFPMVYGERNRGLPLGDAPPRIGARTLADFQRWAVHRNYMVVPFDEYSTNPPERVDEQLELFA